MLEKGNFFEAYPIEKAFQNSGLQWSELQDIYEDYERNLSFFKGTCRELEKYLLDQSKVPMGFEVESLKCRYKNPEHLIEKIIRKCGIEQSHKYLGIDVSNYREIVRDLIGVRILILYKEEWEAVFDWIMQKFDVMEEVPQAYTRYGDRDIFHGKIQQEHSSKGYRSQHYIVKFNGVYCEIQVRTLAEEVYGEFDHRVKYPYRNNNNFLKRYTNIISQLTDSIDEWLSTCFQMGEEGWNVNAKTFDEDEYIDWKKTYKEVQKDEREKQILLTEMRDGNNNIDGVNVVNTILCRKG